MNFQNSITSDSGIILPNEITILHVIPQMTVKSALNFAVVTPNTEEKLLVAALLATHFGSEFSLMAKQNLATFVKTALFNWQPPKETEYVEPKPASFETLIALRNNPQAKEEKKRDIISKCVDFFNDAYLDSEDVPMSNTNAAFEIFKWMRLNPNQDVERAFEKCVRYTMTGFETEQEFYEELERELHDDEA